MAGLSIFGIPEQEREGAESPVSSRYLKEKKNSWHQSKPALG